MDKNETKDSQPMVFITAAILAANALLLPLIAAYIQNSIRNYVVIGVICLQVLLAGFNFMHLKRDGKNIWFIILPTALLCCFLIIALLPDTVFYRQR